MSLTFMWLIMMSYNIYLESVKRCDSVFIQMNEECDNNNTYLCRETLEFLKDYCPPSFTLF